MIALGIILLLVAVLVPKLAALWGVGIVVLLVGVILAVLGTMGRSVGGRRHYY
jgi:membrane-bound ClpP family serine protease